jgi:hypothetical protein
MLLEQVLSQHNRRIDRIDAFADRSPIFTSDTFLTPRPTPL